MESRKQSVLALKKQGYSVLCQVIDPAILPPIPQLVDQIHHHAEMGLEDPFSSYYLRHRYDQGVLYDLYQRHPEFQSLAKQHRVLDVLEGVLGPDIFLYENSLVYKPKNKVNAVPWHQDFISRPHEPKKYVVWMALDDVQVSNDALKVIPVSHQKGYLPWHRVKGETHHDRLDTRYIDESAAKYVELKAGDVLIFDAMLCHSSDEVNVVTNRRAYRVSYQGIASIYTPRGSPLMMRGGNPSSLQSRYSKQQVDLPQKSWFAQAIK
ncbi:phytanoyl-CoA dioxygenase family protein [Zooshikella harenae]|uniref:Phytanoyl-CoA dioxygenase family protein n=1 Tax=Zooshikella harenae TaxID=2827238 RepID=A0ABS5ZEI3_9GAMM|nr:phytanoyl-CoA dioxygenase family protein [Zooshikella harenae]MBU2711721.1 phytanoyl-CoA dioxygenase family protein [Zooshikella harenae]